VACAWPRLSHSRTKTLTSMYAYPYELQARRGQAPLNPTKWEEEACNVCHDQAKWPAGRVERHGRVADAIEKLVPTFSRHKCRNCTVSSCFFFIDYFERQEHAYFLSLMLVSLLSRKTDQTSHQTSEEERFSLR
jgi:hypothetical protein